MTVWLRQKENPLFVPWAVQMDSDAERTFVVVKRIETLASLLRVFDLIHFHYSTNTTPLNYKNIEEVYESQTALYVLIISYLYSLFDKSGINIEDLKGASLSQLAVRKLDKVIELWKPLEKPITRIRHNFGFHGGGLPQILNAHKAAEEIDKNNLLPRIAVLLDELERFAKTLES